MEKTKFTLSVKSFKKMDDPQTDCERVKYVCYVNAASIPQEFSEWMDTNPRDQKMTTTVGKAIKKSLRENTNFHELNRGILMSVEKVIYDNKTNTVEIILDNSVIHGNIDGGHTLEAVLAEEKDILENRYVFFEFITGLDTPYELAAARNTFVQVDTKSIYELKNEFEKLKSIIAPLPFSKDVAYKMNEDKKIDIREVISVVLMFNQNVYPNFSTPGKVAEIQPIQCYSGKETTLRKFISLENRDEQLELMKPIIGDIFALWDKIETTFAETANRTGRVNFCGRKYAKYNKDEAVYKSFFYNTKTKYVVPKGLMYPVVNAFRALIDVDKQGRYSWIKNPIETWEQMGENLTTILLEEKNANPDMLAKNSSLWSNLFKEVYIYGLLNQ